MAVSLTTVSDCDDRAFLCEYCAKSFAVKTELRVHLRSHTGEQPFQCSVCQRAFRHRGHLNCHMMIHTGEKPCLCQFCGKVFRVKSILKKHLRSHTGDRPYICGFCLKAYAKKESLIAHMNIHSKEKNLFCKLCNQDFPSSKNLCHHLKIGSNEKRYFCNLCPKNFPTKSELQVHLRFHYGKKPHLCVICNQGFSTKTYLHIHMEKHNAEKHFSCEFCKEHFNSQFLLNRHAKIHLNLSDLICGFCNNKFSSKHKLLLHFKVHTVKSTQFFFCNECSKTFNYEERFKDHLLTHEKTVYECEICHKCFSYKSKLSSHIRISHSLSQKKKKLARKRTLTIGTKYLHNAAFNAKFSLKDHSKVHVNISQEHMSSRDNQAIFENAIANNNTLTECILQSTKATRNDSVLSQKEINEKSLKNLECKNSQTSILDNQVPLNNSNHQQPQSSSLISSEENTSVEESLSKASIHPTANNLIEISIRTRKTDGINPKPNSQIKKRTISCSVCSKTFKQNSSLKIHMNTHRKLLGDKTLNEETHIFETTKENICTDNFIQDSYEPVVCETSFLKSFADSSVSPNITNCADDSISSEQEFEQITAPMSRHEEKPNLINNNNNNEGWVLNSNAATYIDIQQEISTLSNFSAKESSTNPFVNSLIDREFPNLNLENNSDVMPSSLDILASTAQQKENIAIDETLNPAVPTLPNYVSISLYQEASKCEIMEIGKNDNCTLLEGLTPRNLCICGFCSEENKVNNTIHNVTDDNVNNSPSNTTLTCNQISQNEKNKSAKQKSAKKLSKVNYELGEEAYLCEYCAKTFPTKNDLNIHILSHTREKAFPCHLCKRSFRHKGHLNSHMTIHSGERPFLCQFCSKSFRVKSVMKQHLRSHTGERPFACGFCLSSFAKRDSFVKHLRTHDGSQCHSCKVCFKQFKNEKDFCKHIKSDYKDKHYTCKYCSKDFITKREWHAHLRVHTEGRPFTCELCLKSFTSEAYLIKHLQLH